MSGAGFQLRAHPAAPAIVRALGVELRLDKTMLTLRYAVTGACRWAPARGSRRADDLWRQTCCEFFVAVADDRRYREFNFSPAGEWAVYDFAAYRERLDDPPVAVPPRLTFTSGTDGFVLAVEISLGLLPSQPWHFGLAAVVEGTDGALGYWALAHSRVQPDFHDRSGFAGAFPPREPGATAKRRAAIVPP